MSFIETINEIKNLDSEYRKKCETLLKQAFKEYFIKHPDVDNIRFTAYTPYFNDGEACYYSVGEFYVILKADKCTDECKVHQDDDWYESCEKASSEALNDAGALSRISSDIFMMVFGDHVKVTASIEGFQVDKYDHE